jgi:hypothetical protein
MIIWAIACLIVGYGLDLAGITPIIKRIATSSFTLGIFGLVFTRDWFFVIGGSIYVTIKNTLLFYYYRDEFPVHLFIL